MSEFNTNTEMTKESAVRIMSSRKMITAPGKYHVKVTNDVQALADTGKVHKELSGGQMQVSIANFAAFTPYHLKQFKALLQEGDFAGAANNNLTASVRGTDYIPQKGEIVSINVDFIETKDGEQALLVTGYTALPVSAGRKLSIEELMNSEETEVRAEVKPLVVAVPFN